MSVYLITKEGITLLYEYECRNYDCELAGTEINRLCKINEKDLQSCDACGFRLTQLMSATFGKVVGAISHVRR